MVNANEAIGAYFDEARGLAGVEAAIEFCRTQEGSHGGLVRTMLAPDRIETCTPELLHRTAAASRELNSSASALLSVTHRVRDGRITIWHEPARIIGQPGPSVAARSTATCYMGCRFARY